MKVKRKKLLKIITSSSLLSITACMIIIIPILMLLDFFGVNITDGYIEDNSKYASRYKEVLINNLRTGKGYVSLERIIYFYLEDETLTFDEIYNDNLDNELKQIRPISEVCQIDKYKSYSVCNKESLEESNQIDVIQNKPFTSPLDFKNLYVTSFFKEERIVYEKENIHDAWDFSSPAQTPLYSVCNGLVKRISFPYQSNVIDTSGGAGNFIELECNIDSDKYKVLYGHLYPNSSNLKVGDKVKSMQKIASVGTTGYSTGNHLHFQVSLKGKYIDGLSLIDFNSNILEK